MNRLSWCTNSGIHWCHLWSLLGFPGSLTGKESACNAGDPSLIPGLGRSTGERKSYPLQYSWASLVAQLVENLPAMRETWVRSLGWEDPLEKGKATHSSILVWRIPWSIKSMGSQRIGHDWATFPFTFNLVSFLVIHMGILYQQPWKTLVLALYQLTFFNSNYCF